MKKILFALFLCLSYTTLFAQHPYTIRGIVQDTLAGQKLRNATISVLNAKDSTLYTFTRAAENGSFTISPMRAGNFILLLTYPEYVDYVYPFRLDETKREMDFQHINMKLKATLLNEVLIKGQTIAIKIKGDTTEFNAASYTIQPNDKVEDLLRKLPGIQIDKDGKITARGKTVPKVLVDGAEFFGDDPALVTKNLRADMVDKVQLYEKSSDQAAFTGVEDGDKVQTINIVLKEDKKKGFFGSAEAGTGTDRFYNGRLQLNRFTPDQKFSLFGMTNNNGSDGGFGGAMMISFDDESDFEGGISISEDEMDMDSFGGFGGGGVPTARNGGIHYDVRWNKDKHTLNTNYKINDVRRKETGNVISIHNLPGGMIHNTSDHRGNQYNFGHKADFTYLVKIDTSSNLKVALSGAKGHSDAENYDYSGAKRADLSQLNTGERSLSNWGDNQSFRVSALYTKKLKKKGRNFSLNVTQNSNKSEREGFLYAKNIFFDELGTLTRTEITDQLKTGLSTSAVFSGNVTYTEPLVKNVTVVLNYGLNLNNSDVERQSFNASIPGRYDVLDSQYSNHFVSEQRASQAGAIWSFKNKKSSLNGGVRMKSMTFDQTDQYKDIHYLRSFTNWMPQARYQYRFSQYRSFSMNYNGSTGQPSVEQLQPVKVNDDVMNIPIGNPDLKPFYQNNFDLSYNSYKVMSNSSLYAYAGLGFVNDPIVNNTTTDNETGKTQYQFINLQDKKPLNYHANVYFSKSLKALSIDLNLDANINGNTSYNFINSQLNKTSGRNYGLGLTLSRYVEKKVDFSISFEPRYTRQRSSVNPEINNDGFNYSGRGNIRIFLPGNVQLSANARHSYNAKTASFDNSFSQTIINGSLSKTFFKAENLKLNLFVNDLLNENTGFYRYADANNITQSVNNTIRRYFMLSVVWDFNKMGI